MPVPRLVRSRSTNLPSRKAGAWEESGSLCASAGAAAGAVHLGSHRRSTSKREAFVLRWACSTPQLGCSGAPPVVPRASCGLTKLRLSTGNCPSRLRRLLGLCRVWPHQAHSLTRLINQFPFSQNWLIPFWIYKRRGKIGSSAWVRRPPILHSFPAPRGAAVVPPHNASDSSPFTPLEIRARSDCMNATPQEFFSAGCGEASIRSRASSRSVAPPG